MQANRMELEEEEEGINKINKGNEEKNKLNIAMTQNLDFLNKLKTPEYDKIISKMYNEANLEEEDEDDDKVNETKIGILSELLKKLPETKPMKEKKKKTNKVIKDGMGLLQTLEVTEASLLYQSYKFRYKNYEAYLYSINISALNQIPNYGFIFPIDFGQIYTIKLFNRKTRKIIYAELKREKSLKLNTAQMTDVITFHLCFSNQLIRGKKNIDMNNLNFFLNSLSKNEVYKKYFFVPIFQNNKNIFEIDAGKLDKCVNYLQNNFCEELFPRVSTTNLTPNDKNHENEEIIENLKSSFLITDYKMNKMYKYEDIIFKSDSFNTFINKYTFNNPELSEQIRDKLLECLNKHSKININKINAKFIMEELDIDDDEAIKSKEILGGITGYRRISNKHNINIDKNNKYYLSCKFGPTNFCKQTNFIYNINILKTNLETQNEIILTLKDKELQPNVIENFSKILPPDRVLCYYIEQKDIDTFEYIPSIFINLEEMLKVSQFIQDFNLIKEKSLKEKKLIEQNYPFIQWAFTLHKYVQDFNYESLETLGDSILKMLATTLVYHIYELNDTETNVDKLVFARKTMICNLHLFNKGFNSKIYNYIIRYPKEVSNYSFPLENEKKITGIINISEKIVADIVESSMGGMFLLTKNLKDCFDYLIKLEVPFVEKDDYKFNETKGHFAKKSLWKNSEEYKSLVENSCNIMYKKLENFDKFIFPKKISDIISEKEIYININLRNLMEKYLLKCMNLNKNYKGNYDSLDYLQKCKIFYDFKNKSLLQQAMTHKSKNYSNSKNYEKLELLGDSIVEIFISQYTFCIFGPYLFNDPNESDEENESNMNEYEKLIKKNARIFNNKYMTHIKSYLCSNYFMCKLSILIGLPKLIKFSENNINMKNQLDQFLDFNNINSFTESPLNNYISTEIYQPKFIADLFESLIGAIYIDSDLKTTYEFLHLIYGPSICYSCLYLEDLPFSIVADFTEKCSKELKIVPSFKNVSKEEVMNSGLEYYDNKNYLKLTIGNLFTAIDMGDNEEKAKENLSEKGLDFLDKIRFQGPNENN